MVLDTSTNFRVPLRSKGNNFDSESNSFYILLFLRRGCAACPISGSSIPGNEEHGVASSSAGVDIVFFGH